MRDQVRQTIENLATFSPEEISSVVEACRNFFKSKTLTFPELIAYKNTVSPQRFGSTWFASQQIRLMGLKECSMYDKYDAIDPEPGTITYEFKYATMFARGAHFPQMLRLLRDPQQYIITIFIDDDIKVFRVTGEKMNNSIIRERAKPAHADNPNELEINVKRNCPIMAFLETCRDQELEKLFKSSTYKVRKSG